MKTTMNIDEELLREAMKASGSRTMTQAVEAGLRELIAAKKRRELVSLFGGLKNLSVPPRRRFK